MCWNICRRKTTNVLVEQFNERLCGLTGRPDTWKFYLRTLAKNLWCSAHEAISTHRGEHNDLSTLRQSAFSILQPYIGEYNGNHIANRQTYQAAEGFQQVRQAIEKARLMASPLVIEKQRCWKGFRQNQTCVNSESFHEQKSATNFDCGNYGGVCWVQA